MTTKVLKTLGVTLILVILFLFAVSILSAVLTAIFPPYPEEARAAAILVSFAATMYFLITGLVKIFKPVKASE